MIITDNMTTAYMQLNPADGNCIVAADGTIVWSDDVFNEWFSFHGIMPGVKISQLFTGEKDIFSPGAVFEDTDRLGKKRYFALESRTIKDASGTRVSEEVRIRIITLRKVLTDISRLAAQARTPNDLFEKVLWLLRDTTNYLAFAGYISREGYIELVASKGWTEKLKSYISVQDIAPDTMSLAGRTAYHRQQIVMAMRDYALRADVKSAITKLGGEYIVVTPLVDQDRLAGVLTVINDKVLTPADSEVLQLICVQVAAALSLKLQEEQAVKMGDDAVLYANLIEHSLKDNSVLFGAAGEGKFGPEAGKALRDTAKAAEASASFLVKALNDGTDLETIPVKDAIDRAAAKAKAMAAAINKKAVFKVSGTDQLMVSPLFIFAAYEALKNSVVYSSAPTVEVEVRIARERTGAHRIEISDNGPGIPDELKSEVFRHRKTGTVSPDALGLYLVKTIANKFGGRVWAEDRVRGDYKKGASIVITLPADRQP
jgi:two-component system, OmpR family, sensor histidine kinase KdpD